MGLIKRLLQNYKIKNFDANERNKKIKNIVDGRKYRRKQDIKKGDYL